LQCLRGLLYTVWSKVLLPPVVEERMSYSQSTSSALRTFAIVELACK
jgi:hypothetical protein